MLRSAYSIKKTFKLFLETPGTFKAILNYIENLKKDNFFITNIMQCERLKKLLHHSADYILLPFYIFYDEFECGNPLAGHAGKNKFAAIYAALACLPEYLASKLESILFSTLIPVPAKKLLDQDEGSNEQIFKTLIEELNDLQRNGIFIDVDGWQVQVKFKLVLILGDSLGLNDILGFIESFNTSFCCRMCKATISQIHTLTIENTSILRTKINYELDAQTPEPSKTGIKEPCVFHKVDGFHNQESVSVDGMHDAIESVAACVMHAITKHRILDAKYFDLDFLNVQIKNLNFGSEETYNKPAPILINRLKDNNENTLKMSASETITYTYFFGIMVGIYIPQDDQFWKLYKKLRKILDIVLSPRIVRSDVEILKNLIDKHHELYKILVGPLTAKFHN